jgi:symplekin
LSKLLSEAPDLPLAALDLLQALCNPGSGKKDELESPVTERITQGLSAVWSLILLRPPIRSVCLDIALQVIVFSTLQECLTISA